jgi:(E)-4-hydroxy-3-methylbut-2-enyl-diphosphate synthase
VAAVVGLVAAAAEADLIVVPFEGTAQTISQGLQASISPGEAVTGSVTIGGEAPVSVQSMTNTRTADARATLAQVEQLAAAGADLVRVAVPTADDTAALREIVAAAPCPIIADVHFHADRAVEAIAAGAHKIRLNPGNIADPADVRRVIAAAADAGTAIRVGVNEGSVVERRDGSRRAGDLARPLHELMLERLGEYLRTFEEAGFAALVLSAKSHDAMTCVAANRLIADRWDYPLHLGVTHSGTASTGAIRSAAAIGTPLAEGIGETIRISYAGDPVAEVRAAVELLASLRLRRREGVELIACPTCGRVEMDIAPVVERVREALADVRTPLTVAIMGCVVNGPGEADNADVAVCAGKRNAVLYRRGKKVRAVPAEEIVEAVVAEVRKLASTR